LGKKKKNKKNDKMKTIMLVTAIAVVVLALGGYIWYSSITSYVATIAGNKISSADYKYFLSTVKYQMENDANINDEESKKAFWDSKVDGIDAKEIARQRALDSIKEYKIQLIKAKESGLFLNDNDIKIIDDSIEQFFNEIILSNQVASKDQNIKKPEELIKEMYGISVEECKNVFKNLRLIYKFVDQEQKKIDVAEEELKKRYNENKDTFDTVDVRHILLSTWNKETGEPLSEEEKKKKYEEAEEILERVNNGENMEKLATELSDDGGVDKNKGLLQVDYFKDLVEDLKPFTDWAVKNKVGDTSIVETSFGYHVVKIEGRTEYADVVEKVRNVVLSEKYDEILKEWVKDPKYDIIKNEFAIGRIKV
jgi:foldase protein PrsA